MKHFLLRLEPLIWLMFGQGILIGTILLTGWLIVFGVALPFGWVGFEDGQALDYSRAYGLASNFVGQAVLLALIALPLWKGAHHLRHLSLDHGGADYDPVVALSLYAIAAGGSIAALLAVIRL